MRRKKEFYEYPKRVCYSMHHCEVCDNTIHALQEYYDGGYGRRCHVACAPPVKPPKGGEMKDKLLNLIKTYRAEAERQWTMNTANSCGRAATWDKCADDLEELVRHLSPKPTEAKGDVGGEEKSMTRNEHLEWCKQRALKYVDMDDTSQAWSSMLSDMRTHPETANHSALKSGMMLLMAGQLSSPSKMREFIVGFN